MNGIVLADLLTGRERGGLGSKAFAVTRLEGIGIEHRLALEADIAPRWRRVDYFRNHWHCGSAVGAVGNRGLDKIGDINNQDQQCRAKECSDEHYRTSVCMEV